MTVGVCYSHICVGPEASCMPGRPCWGFPRTGSKTAGNGTCPGRHTGLPELPRSDSKSARLSRGRVAILPEGRADMRARRLHNWAHLGHERRGATSNASDSKGGDGSVDRLGGWCMQRLQCCPYRPVPACCVAAILSGAEQAIVLRTRGDWYTTAVGALSRARSWMPVTHGTPAHGRCICWYNNMPGYLHLGDSCPKKGKIWPRAEGLMAGQGDWDSVRAASPCPSRDPFVKPALKWSHMKQTEWRDSRCHMPQEPLKLFQWNRPLALERLQAVQHRLSTL